MFFPASPEIALPSAANWRSFWPAHAVLFARARFALSEGLRALRTALGLRRAWIPAYLCCPVPEAVRAAGLIPVLYDVDERLAPRTETVAPRPGDAFLVVHYFGLLAPLSALRTFCTTTGMPLVEDCAHALPHPSGGGAGSVGDVSVFSLRKVGPLPGGGLLVVRDRRVRDAVRVPPGQRLPDRRTLARLGVMLAERVAERLQVNLLHLKDRLPVLDQSGETMDAIPPERAAEYERPPGPASLVRLMLEHTDWHGALVRRRHAYRELARRIAGISAISLPVPEPTPMSVPETLPVFHREPGAVVVRLRGHGVEASRWPGTEQFPFDGHRFSGAAAWRDRGLCLPLPSSRPPSRLDRLAAIAIDVLAKNAPAATSPAVDSRAPSGHPVGDVLARD